MQRIHHSAIRNAAGGLAAALAFALTLGVLSPAPAHAQWLTTDALVANCKNENPEYQAFCVGYIAGTLHTLVVPEEMIPRGQFCLEGDKQPTLTGFAENLIKLREKQPKLGEAPAFQVIAAMLQEGFPCGEDVPDVTGKPAATPNSEQVPDNFFGLGGGGNRPVIKEDD